MIEHYLSHEEYGPERAIARARELRDWWGYKILKIEHTQVPMAGSTSTPYSPTWGKTELGYRITVETEGYEPGDKILIPEIVEC